MLFFKVSSLPRNLLFLPDVLILVLLEQVHQLLVRRLFFGEFRLFSGQFLLFEVIFLFLALLGGLVCRIYRVRSRHRDIVVAKPCPCRCEPSLDQVGSLRASRVQPPFRRPSCTKMYRS